MESNFPHWPRQALAALAATACLACPVQAQHQSQQAPQYGGTLNIGTVYLTMAPLSFDPADWTWKFNHDMGLAYESLFAADLGKSQTHGGPYEFSIDAYLPPEAMRGELAESWQLLQNPPGVEIKLRKGIMFPAKKGVMAARELTAQDVVYSYQRYNDSARRMERVLGHIEKVEALDTHTVRFTFKHYNAEWDYRFGWGYYNAIMPKEVVEAGIKNWRNANGTGPYALKNYVQGNTVTFAKNPNYWDSVTLAGKDYKLPFADTINYRIIRDPASAQTALRTARLDIMESVPWNAVEELKKNAPQLQWRRTLSANGNTLALRVDVKPFDDVRVRRALNMAVDRQQIIQTLMGGEGELLSYPMHPQYGPYFEPLEEMPQTIRDLFSYKPEEAKKLLAEAGYPDGFSFKAQSATTNPRASEMLSMLAAQWEKVGVKMEIVLLDYPAHLSAMTTKTHAPGYFISLTGTNPTVALQKSFVTNELWNPSQYTDPAFDAKVDAMLKEPLEAKRQHMLRAMNREILEAAPHIWLPTPYQYTAWWPWVKNYGGELRAGAERPGPIHARVWVDQQLKKELGF